jgi:hypothetical protein
MVNTNFVSSSAFQWCIRSTNNSLMDVLLFSIPIGFSRTKRNDEPVVEQDEEIEIYEEAVVNTSSYEETALAPPSIAVDTRPSAVPSGIPLTEEKPEPIPSRPSRRSIPPPPIPAQSHQAPDSEPLAPPRPNRRSVPPPPPPIESISSEFEDSETRLSPPPQEYRQSSTPNFPLPDYALSLGVDPMQHPPRPDGHGTMSPPTRDVPSTLAIYDRPGEVFDDEEGGEFGHC